MIGIAVDGIPIAGIIHKPFLVETVLGVNLPGFRLRGLFCTNDVRPFKKPGIKYDIWLVFSGRLPILSGIMTNLTVLLTHLLKEWCTLAHTLNEVQYISHLNHLGRLLEDVEKVLNETYGLNSDEFELMPAGGSGFKSLELVHGRAMYYVHPSIIKLWDLCAPAGKLIFRVAPWN